MRSSKRGPILLLAIFAAGAARAAEPEPPPLNPIFEQVKRSVVELVMVAPNGSVRGNGSGFLVRADGWVVTNHHVIEDHPGLQAQFIDGARRPVLGVYLDDKEHDVAVIQIEGKDFPFLTLAEAVPTRPGTPVSLVAAPQGLGWTWSEGVVAAFRPQGLPPELLEGSDVLPPLKQALLQLNLPSGQGASGGPVLDASGNVVAIIHSGHGSVSSMMFAAPVETIRRALEQAGAATLMGMHHRGRNLLLSAAIFALLVVLWKVRTRPARSRARVRPDERQ